MSLQKKNERQERPGDAFVACIEDVVGTLEKRERIRALLPSWKGVKQKKRGGVNGEVSAGDSSRKKTKAVRGGGGRGRGGENVSVRRYHMRPER